jgi:hypothetical protein
MWIYGACIEFVSSLVWVLSYCMHAARAFQLVTEDELTMTSTALLYNACALGVTSPLERELFIAERQRIFQFCLQRRHVLMKLSLALSS